MTPGTLAGPTPLISGTRKVGYVLAAAPGAWTPGTTLKYPWYRSGVLIPGATGSRYTLTAADKGKIMRLRVAGLKSGYTTLIKDSATTAAVVAGTLIAGTPWVSGYPRYGYTLAANPRTWTAGTTLRYQWYRSGVAIRGATGRYYRLAWADRYRQGPSRRLQGRLHRGDQVLGVYRPDPVTRQAALEGPGPVRTIEGPQ